MTREEVVKQVAVMVRNHIKGRKPTGTVINLEGYVEGVVGEKYPRANYGKDQDYRFGPADVLELEREMRRQLKV